MALPADRRFWFLRRLSGAFTVSAWVVLVLVVVVTPVAVIRAWVQGNQDDLFFWLKYAASGLLIYINLIWIGQSIQAILAIEENTRHGTYVLERLTTLAQQIRDRLPAEPREDESDTGAGGGGAGGNAGRSGGIGG
jgi:hypothetical protein